MAVFRSPMARRWGFAAALAMAAPAYGAPPVNFIDPNAVDPLAFMRGYVGVGRDAFKSAFPVRTGIALGPQCRARIKPFHKGNVVERIMIVIDGPLCQGMAIRLLSRLHGPPREGGYGYATAIATAGAVSTMGHSIVTLKWCPSGFDVMALYPANWSNGLSIFLFLPGQYDPDTGKRAEPGSKEHLASCPHAATGTEAAVPGNPAPNP